MPLRSFQDALGAWVSASSARCEATQQGLTLSEETMLRAIAGGAGFRLTREIQRSWCAARAARTAQMTFLAIPTTRRLTILNAWVEAGGGASAVTEQEGEALFDFIADRLPDPSVELDTCRIEQASLRAQAAASDPRPPDLGAIDLDDTSVHRSPDAAMVRLSGLAAGAANDPSGKITAEQAPGSGPTILFAPNLVGFFRPAKPREERLWRDAEAACSLGELIALGHSRRAIRSMIIIGALGVDRRRAALIQA